MRLKTFSSAFVLLLLLAGCGKTVSSSPPVAPAAVASPEALAQAGERLLAAAQGQVVELPGVDLAAAGLMPYSKQEVPGPQYLISDDPEYIRVPEAAALREEVEPGAVRLYVYNVNGVKEPEEMPRKITAVIENLGTGELHLRMKRSAFPKPSGNYFHIGKTGLFEFLSAVADQPVRVAAPGETIPIDPEMENTTVVYNDLVHGFYEFEIDQPARITVLQTAPDTPGPVANARLEEVLPTKSHSGAGRGKFLTSNYRVTAPEGFVLDSALGPAKLIVADGDIDPWVTGTEHTIDEPAVLKGNYGILYDIRLPYRSNDGRGLALVTWNARFGSQWCGGMAASMMVGEGKFPAGPVMIPSDRLVTKSAPEAVLIQVFPPPPPGETGWIELTYSPPGASCLPTPLVFLPVEIPAASP